MAAGPGSTPVVIAVERALDELGEGPDPAGLVAFVGHVLALEEEGHDGATRQCEVVGLDRPTELQDRCDGVGVDDDHAVDGVVGGLLEQVGRDLRDHREVGRQRDVLKELVR